MSLIKFTLAMLISIASLASAWSSQDEVVTWEPGRLDLFFVEPAQPGSATSRIPFHLWHYSNAGTSLSRPDDLGKPPTKFSGRTAAVAWSRNRLDAFAITVDGHLWHIAWDGAQWQPWDDRGKPQTASLLGTPVAVSWGPNRLDVFALGTDGHIWHTAWNGAQWQTWDDRGRPLLAQPTIDNLAAVSWGPNRLDVFIVASDDHVWHTSWNGAQWQAAWDDRGRPAPGFIGTGIASRFRNLRAVSWGENRLDVFVTGSDNRLRHTAWNGTRWQSWDDQSRPSSAAIQDVAVTSWGPNRLDIFTLGLDNRVWHTAWNGTQWQPWDDRGVPGFVFSPGPGNAGLVGGSAPHFSAVAWGSNRLDAFIVTAQPNVSLPCSINRLVWDGVQWSDWFGVGSIACLSEPVF